MIKNDKTNIDEKYKIEKIHDKIKFKAFGKVTIRQRIVQRKLYGNDSPQKASAGLLQTQNFLSCISLYIWWIESFQFQNLSS